MLSILKFLKLDLELENETLLDQILFDDDEEGSSVFSNLFTKSQEKHFYSNFFDFFETNLKLPEEDLENHLKKEKFLLFGIAQIEKLNRDEILNFFCRKIWKNFSIRQFSFVRNFTRKFLKYIQNTTATKS
jgi:hypothetical protein